MALQTCRKVVIYCRGSQNNVYYFYNCFNLILYFIVHVRLMWGRSHVRKPLRRQHKNNDGHVIRDQTAKTTDTTTN